MRAGLAIPLPGFRRRVRVNVESTQRRETEPAGPVSSGHHTHTGDELKDAIVWFAYRDDDDGVARAFCAELSLVVERPTVAAANEEMKILVADYLRDAEARGEMREQFRRPLPNQVLDVHLTRLSRALDQHSDEAGTAWVVGHLHVTDAQVPAASP